LRSPTGVPLPDLRAQLLARAEPAAPDDSGPAGAKVAPPRLAE